MKIVLFLIAVSITQALALESNAQTTKLNLNVKNAKIVEILNTIENQSDFFFMYDATVVNVNQKRSINCENKTVTKILDELFENTGITYKIEDRLIALSNQRKSVNGTVTNFMQQQKNISGKVTDSSGVPLPGVTVVIKGTTTGIVTDVNGEYSLSNIPNNATLQFSFVGMKAQEIVVIGKAVINVKMKEVAVGIDEVVAIGYGTQKKVNLTGSVSAINFDEQLENRPITNVSQALSGKISGLWVSQGSGKPGSDGARLRVRGWGTLNDASPMVLIDGVEGSMEEVNPNDIKSVSVLKDAASSAIYGSRAANGIILIQTKGGNYNEKTKVKLTSYVGSQSIGRKYDIVDNSVEYMQLWNQGLKNSGTSPLFSEDVINDFKNNKDPYLYPNTDFFDEVYRNALITESQITVSGGSSNTKYYMSMNRLDQDGIMKATSSDRYGFDLKLETKITDWFNIGAKISTSKRSSKEPFNIGRVNYVFSNGAYPFISPYTKDDRLGAVQTLDSDGNILVGNRNPMIEIEEGSNNTDLLYSNANIFAGIDITKELVFKSNLSIRHTNVITDASNDLKVGYTSDGLIAPNLDYGQVKLQNSRSTSNSEKMSWFNTLNFKKQFSNIHSISAIAGMQVESFKIRTVGATRTDPSNSGLTQIDAGTAGITNSGNMNRLRMLSYFGRINYVLKDRYLLEFNLRNDASSRFKRGNRQAFFPGISGGWIINEEEFFNDKLFSLLKLRASYGKLGNQNGISYWPYLTTIGQTDETSYNFDGSYASGAAVTGLTDESISWETTSTYDVGLEMGFLKNNLLFEAVYFNKFTNDIIVQLPIPQLLGGLTAPYENVGEMLNKGLEFNISYNNTRNSSFQKLQYSVDLNLGYIDNEVQKFKGGNSPDQLFLIREGYSYNTLYTWKAIGIFQSNEEANTYMLNSGYKPEAGDLKYEDVNGDGKMDYRDFQDVGSTIPKFTFGGSVKLNYKKFSLLVLFQGVSGVSAYTKNAWTTPLGISGGTITKRWENSWTETNKQTDVPILKLNDSWNWQESSFWISNVSFLKVRNIQLGYNFTNNKLWFDDVYLYLNAENMITFVNKDYEGLDPEEASNTGSGRDLYPLPKTVSIGVNINF